MFKLKYKNTNFHRVSAIRSELPSTTVIATVTSYLDEAAYLSNSKGEFFNEVIVPFSAIGNNVARSIEQWIIAQPNNIFYQGNIIPAYSTDPLVAAKDKQWVLIKAKRAELIASIDMDLSANEINNQIAAIKAIAIDLKAQIYAATEIEDVLPITWPS